MSVVNFNDSTPSAPGGKINVKWQQSDNSVSAYVDTPSPITRAINTTAPLTGGGDLSADRTLAISDFTGDTGTGGAKGAVPAPGSGDAAAGKFLAAGGGWVIPAGTSTGTVTHTGGDLTADLPMFGAGAADSKVGTKSGNTDEVATVTGAVTSGHLATWDADGNLVDGGVQGAGQPYDVVCSLVGKPADAAIVLILTAVRAVNFAANFAGAYGSVAANPAATATYTVLNGVTTIGTVAISTGGVFTFATTSGTSKALAAGDRLTITAPTPQDTTLSDAGFTLAGTR